MINASRTRCREEQLVVCPLLVALPSGSSACLKVLIATFKHSRIAGTCRKRSSIDLKLVAFRQSKDSPSSVLVFVRMSVATNSFPSRGTGSGLRPVAIIAELTGAEDCPSSDRQDPSVFQKLWELNDHT